MAKTKTAPKMTKRERSRRERERSREEIIRISSWDITKSLFERAHKEPHVLGLEVTSMGMQVKFQAMHPQHVHEMLDLIETWRKKAKERKKQSTPPEGNDNG